MTFAGRMFVSGVIALFFYLMASGGYQNTGLYWCLTLVPLCYYSVGYKDGIKITLFLSVSTICLLNIPFFSTWIANYPDSLTLRYPAVLIALSLLIFWQELSRYKSITFAQKMKEALEIQATTDSLSNLLNRRGVEKILLKDIASQSSQSHMSGILIADIDHFKQINDKYGHMAGDEVIKAVSNVMKANIRGDDSIGRWGGEEFLIYLKGADKTRIKQVAERLRASVQRMHVEFNGETINCTISIGASQTQLSNVYHNAINITDRALYKAKQNGRNKVVFTEGEPG